MTTCFRVAAVNEINEASKKYPEINRDSSALLIKLIATNKVNKIRVSINTTERLEGIPKLFFDSNGKKGESQGIPRVNPAIAVAGFKPIKVFPVSLGTR